MTTAVIIVSYNTGDLLRECLKSFLATQSGDYEIWVIDNSSSDGSPEMVEQEFSHVHLVKSDVNLGFGKANNQLVAQSKSDYVLLINPDTVLTEDILGPMLDYLDSEPSVGIVGPKVVSADGSLQLSCEMLPSLKYEWAWQVHGASLGRLFRSGPTIAATRMEDYDHTKPRRVEFLWATCWLMRREVIEQHGLFDENFRMYDEDLDLCARMASTNWGIHYFPLVSMVHLGGMSSTPVRKQIMMRRGRRIYYRRHKGWPYAFAYRASLLGFDLLKAAKHAALALVGTKRGAHWEKAKEGVRLARL
ncbi:MAG: glycosyltransferase family 2 protein [Armatimonadetes bacterium]|nr:glycosyltransferase family 2 protein [Armatimonadota bacterium]